MRALGFEVKKVDVLKILKDYDREGNGKITFEDFSEVGKFQARSFIASRIQRGRDLIVHDSCLVLIEEKMQHRVNLLLLLYMLFSL